MAQRASRLEPYLDDIRREYDKCGGNLVRVQEELEEALKKAGQDAEISYSTLTWFCREHGIGVEAREPVRRIVTGPGEEMQHDTSPHKPMIGGRKAPRHCASLVLGHSRMMYFQFYPRFQRFHMKAFLTDAFKYFGGCCRRCILDNSSIAIACGTGKLARMAPEVESFEKRFGFEFVAHELGHKERSGKVERPFGYIEGNFLAGRVFKDDDDLNCRAIEWLEEKANRRIHRELRARPIDLFAAEKPYLVPLPLYVPDVYRTFQRLVDVYSRVSVDQVKYPVPADYIGKVVLVRESKDRVKAFDGSKEIADHKKKVRGSPSSEPERAYGPKRQSRARLLEEDKLKALGAAMTSYLELLKSERGARYVWSVKKLYRLSCRYEAAVLERAVALAAEHRLLDAGRVETIVLQDVAQREFQLPLGSDAQEYESWPQYRQGATTPEPDLKRYLPETKPEEDPHDP